MPALGLGLGLALSSGIRRLDPDAAAYIAAVEAADGQALETNVKAAYNKFIRGCKSDGIWDAIKASCILAGARSLSGALVPLKGSAPTNNNFVSGDYVRKTGLVGNGTTKFLDSNRANNADPQDSNHNAVYASFIGGVVGGSLIAANGSPSNNTNAILGSTITSVFTRNRSFTGTSSGVIPSPGLIGTSRSSSANYILRVNGSDITTSVSSGVPEGSSVLLFRRGDSAAAAYALHRLAFYSIGESLNLAALDARVTTLQSDISAALP
jgi:hypothetical protein